MTCRINGTQDHYDVIAMRYKTNDVQNQWNVRPTTGITNGRMCKVHLDLDHNGALGAYLNIRMICSYTVELDAIGVV